MAVLKCIFLLLSCWSFTGVMATELSFTHYQLKNSSLCLHVSKPPPYTSGDWSFDNLLIATKGVIHPSYKERVMFENMTLCLIKLTENDTGIFTASYSSGFSKQSEKHQVIVQELVPMPVMTVIPENPYNISSELCNFTVNCSIQDVWLLSTCDKDVCKASLSSVNKFNITIFTEETVIVCSGNNYVSSNNISDSIPTLCFRKSNLENKNKLYTNPSIFLIIIIIIIIIIITIIIAAAIHFPGVFCFVIKCSHGNPNQGTTSVAQLIQSGPLDTQQSSEPRVSTSSSEADPSYENVETNQAQENGISRHEQVFSESQVDTIYSVPKKAASSVKSDKTENASGGGNTQNTSGSVDTSEKNSQTETLYSVLQMP